MLLSFISNCTVAPAAQAAPVPVVSSVVVPAAVSAPMPRNPLMAAILEHASKRNAAAGGGSADSMPMSGEKAEGKIVFFVCVALG